MSRSLPVIASEAKQSRATREALDCFVADAPRNDDDNSLRYEQLRRIP